MLAAAAADDQNIHKSLLRRELQAASYKLQVKAETLSLAACGLRLRLAVSV
jgi:hypothetical protein